MPNTKFIRVSFSRGEGIIYDEVWFMHVRHRKKSKGEMGDAQWGGETQYQLSPQKRYPRQEKKIKSSREEKEPKETPR